MVLVQDLAAKTPFNYQKPAGPAGCWIDKLRKKKKSAAQQKTDKKKTWKGKLKTAPVRSCRLCLFITSHNGNTTGQIRGPSQTRVPAVKKVSSSWLRFVFPSWLLCLLLMYSAPRTTPVCNIVIMPFHLLAPVHSILFAVYAFKALKCSSSPCAVNLYECVSLSFTASAAAVMLVD